MAVSGTVYAELTSTRKLTSSATPRVFRRWKTRIEFVLFDANIEYVLSSPKPSSSRKTLDLDRWLHDDRRCKSTILFAMDDLLFDVFNLHVTSKQIMDSLAEIFGPSNLYEVLTNRKYHRVNMDEDTPINHHLLEMQAHAVDLEHVGMPVDDQMQKRVILRSLPGSWGKARSSITEKKDMSLQDAMRRLRKEKELRKLGGKVKEEEEEEEDGLEGGRKRLRTENRVHYWGNVIVGEPRALQEGLPR